MAFVGASRSFMPKTMLSLPTGKPCHQKPLVIKCAKRNRPKPSSGSTPPQINSVLRAVRIQFREEVILVPSSLNIVDDTKKTEVLDDAIALKTEVAN
ncbi:hypothetical protein GH714_026224 [Hevea brasiliensis]|uniref:Uncharacterized protein n=1 Tax=Hevea brasiliensis TaxID=3981 RepID=A0A6A6MQ78_HEVBR|nr:hypothetical protein GH714_026224 [Hevea brasiliensis]